MKSHFQLQAQKGVPLKLNLIIPTHLSAFKLEKVSPEKIWIIIISNHRDSLGACKGENGGLYLRVQKVRDAGMGDPVVGLWLGVQK